MVGALLGFQAQANPPISAAPPAAPPATPVAPATPEAKEAAAILDQAEPELRQKIEFWREHTRKFFAGQKMEEPVDDHELQVPIRAYQSYKSQPDHPDDRYLGVPRFWVYDMGVLIDYFVERGEIEEADWLADQMVELAKEMERQGKKGGWRFSHGVTFTDARSMSGATAWVFHGLYHVAYRTQDPVLLNWLNRKLVEIAFAQQVMDPKDPRHGLFRAGFGTGSPYDKGASEEQREEASTEHTWNYINVLRMAYRAIKAVDPQHPLLKEIIRRHDLAMRMSREKLLLTPEILRAQMERLRQEGVLELDEKLEKRHQDALAEIERLPGKMRWSTGIIPALDEEGKVAVWYRNPSRAGDNESWSPHAAYDPAMGLNELKNLIARFLIRLPVKEFELAPAQDIHGNPVDPEETLMGSIFFTKDYGDPHLSPSDEFERMLQPEQTWGEAFRFFQQAHHDPSPEVREWARQWALYLTWQMLRLDEIYGDVPYSTNNVATEQYGKVEGIFTTMAGAAGATHQGIVLESLLKGVPSTTYINTLPDPDMLVDGKPPVWSTTEIPKPVKRALSAEKTKVQPPVPPAPDAKMEPPAPEKAAEPRPSAKPAAPAVLRLPAGAVTPYTVSVTGLPAEWAGKVAQIWILQDQYYRQDTEGIGEDGSVDLVTPYDAQGWVKAVERGKLSRPGIVIAIFDTEAAAQGARNTFQSPTATGGDPRLILAIDKVGEDGSATGRVLQGALPAAKPPVPPAPPEETKMEPPAPEKEKAAKPAAPAAKPKIQAEIVKFGEEAVTLRVTGAPKEAVFVLFVKVGAEWYIEPWADDQAASRINPDTGEVTVETVIRDGRGQIVPGRASIVVFSSKQEFDEFMEGYRGYRLTMDKRSIHPTPAAVIQIRTGPQGKPRADVSGVWIIPKLIPDRPAEQRALAAFFANPSAPFPFLLLAGLEEAQQHGYTRRDFLRWTGSAALAAAAAAVELPLLGQAPRPRQVIGAMAPLANRLGPSGEIAPVVWGNPGDILGLPNFFANGVRAGATTLWISGYAFLGLPAASQQQILDMANRAGLRRLGLVDGAPNWLQNRAFVEKLYQRLFQTLSQRNLGRLELGFGVDVEPYIPEYRPETGWNGDLSGYSTFLDEVVLPPIKAFAEQAKAQYGRVVVTGSQLTRFEPYWYRNGRRTDDGFTIRGLRDFPKMVIAGMTYANTSGELLGLSTDVRIRAQQAEGVFYQLGAETLPGAEVGGEHLTFNGREEGIPGTVLEALDALPREDMQLLSGLFVNLRTPKEANGVFERWLRARPTSPAAVPEKPEEPAAGKGIEVIEGSLRRTHTQLAIRLRNARPGARAVFLLKTDRYYTQPREGASVAVGADGSVIGTTPYSPPNRPGWLGAREAVILIFASQADANRFHATVPREIGLGRVPAREDIEPVPLEVIRISKGGEIEIGAVLDWSLVAPLAGPVFGPDLLISMRQGVADLQLAAAGLEESGRARTLQTEWPGEEEEASAAGQVVVQGVPIPSSGRLMNWYSTVDQTGAMVPLGLQEILDPSEDRLVVPLAEVSLGTVVHVQERFDAAAGQWVPVISGRVVDALEAAAPTGGIELKRFRIDQGAPEAVPDWENVYIVDLEAGRERNWIGAAGIVINMRGGEGPVSPQELGALINAARAADDQVLRAPRLYRSTVPEVRDRVIALDTQL